MARIYKPFFLLYGGVHLVAGLMIAAVPQVMSPVLITPLEPGAATLLGFLSALAGLGFLGGAFAESQKVRQLFVILAIAGNVLNAAAHLSNSLRGFSPVYMAIGGGVGVLVMIGILVAIGQSLKSAPRGI